MHRAYIALGANLGDRSATLNEAVRAIDRLGIINRVSSIYETEPVGYTDQPAYLNAVVGLLTLDDPHSTLRSLLEIEADFGRVRTFQNAPRTLDLDLLLADDLIIESAELTLPHPRMHERAFVLVPLAEIAPTLLVPGIGKTVSDLLGELGPITGVERVAQFDFV